MTGTVDGLLELAGSFLLTIVGFHHFVGFTIFYHANKMLLSFDLVNLVLEAISVL